jgi:glycosyltransferase involved in cell wall biosynthesis
MSYLPAENKLLVLGSGPLEGSLKLKISERNLTDRVLLLGDVPNERVPHFLVIADVFVRPSLAEGLGNSFLEAMAAGVPIIGTKVGGIPDFLKPGVTGYFCEVKDPKSIAEKISYILNADNFEEIKKIKEAARQMVGERYSWNKIASQMKEIFSRLTL